MESPEPQRPQEPTGLLPRLRALEAALAELRAENAALRQERRDLLLSTSWRITAPLRWLATRLRRGAAPAPVLRPAEAAAEAAEGVATLPGWMRLAEAESLEAANATCRRISLHPGLQGVLPERVRLALESPDTAGGEYLGWGEDPPAIGFIGSDELRTELAFDARVVALREEDWERALVPGALRFLLVETVWHAGQRQWRYALTGGDRSGFLRLLARCREISLPVVAWFRETPGNYAHFAWLAGHVDLACAADPEVEARLRRDFPGTRIESLPPAIQPALHNPLRGTGLMRAADALRDRIVFDGWWDLARDLPELPRLRALKPRLLVAESEWDYARVRLDDNPEFRAHAIGCLGREEKLALSRLQGAEVFAAAPVTGAWRGALNMARAAASGSLVARLDGAMPSLPALRLPETEGGDVPAALDALLADPLARARRAHLAWRALMSAHTLAHRLQAVADALALDARFLPPEPRIACLLVTMRPDRLQDCLRRFREDLYPHRELVVVVHGDDADPAGYRRWVRDGEPIRIFSAGRNRGLGACLNFAADQTDAPYWTKMDDDDLYGPHYLGDMMLYQRTGRFEVFGKPPVFNYFERDDALLWDGEWARHANLVHEAGSATSALVAGGTLGGSRRALERVCFSEARRGGSDSDFIRRCYEAGLDVLAMDGFNFVRFRSAREGFHTWNADEDEMRARSRRVGGMADLARSAMI